MSQTEAWPNSSNTPRPTIFTWFGGFRPRGCNNWMDMAGVLSVAPWAARPAHIPGVDRPAPLIHLINGGEAAAKSLLRGG